VQVRGQVSSRRATEARIGYWRGQQPGLVSVAEPHLVRRIAPLAILSAALGGTALVHLLEYHSGLPLLGTGRWAAYVTFMLVHCSLMPVIVGVLAGLGLLIGAALLYAHALCARRAALARRVARLQAPDAGARAGYPRPARDVYLPRSPLRYLTLVVAIAGLQAAAYAVLVAALPMEPAMRMAGSMVMAALPAAHLPLLPLHLVTAALLGLLLWFYERRVLRLRQEVRALTVALARRYAAADTPLPPVPRPVLSPRRPHFGAALFSRPPPCAPAYSRRAVLPGRL